MPALPDHGVSPPLTPSLQTQILNYRAILLPHPQLCPRAQTQARKPGRGRRRPGQNQGTIPSGMILGSLPTFLSLYIFCKIQ